MHNFVRATKVTNFYALEAIKEAKVHKRRQELVETVLGELNAKFGPFENTEEGRYKRIDVCIAEYGVTPGDIVQAKLTEEGLVK